MEFPYKLFDASYSKQAMLDVVTNQSICFGLAEKIRKMDNNITIIIIPNPLITSHLKQAVISTHPGIIPNIKFGNPTKLSDNPFPLWQSVLEQVFKNIGVRFCFQNQVTITDLIFTKPNFALDPLSVPGGIRHTNKAFWEHIWIDLNKIICELEESQKDLTFL